MLSNWECGALITFGDLHYPLPETAFPSLALPVDCLILSHPCIDTSSATWDKVAMG